MHIENEQKRHSYEMAHEKEKAHRLLMWVIGVSGYMVLTIIAVIIIAIQNRRLKARNKELYIRYEETQKLEEELVELRKSAEMPPMVSPDFVNQTSSPSTEGGIFNPSANHNDREDDGEYETGSGDENNDGLIANNLSHLAEKIVKIMNDENEVTQQDFTLEKLSRLTLQQKLRISSN